MVSMKVFIDESGNHNLDKIDNSFPFFCLGAVIIEDEEYEQMRKALNVIKQEFFGSEDFILHSAELRRPANKKSHPGNVIMLKPDVRARVYQKITDEVINAFDFKVVYCVIQKEKLSRAYYSPIDPYHLSFENLLNRIIRYGGTVNNIFAERRDQKLDRELIATYERYRETGNQEPRSKLSPHNGPSPTYRRGMLECSSTHKHLKTKVFKLSFVETPTQGSGN